MGTGHEFEDFDFDSIEIEDPAHIDGGAFEYAETLLDTCALDVDQKQIMQWRINNCSLPFEMEEIINEIKAAQPCRIDGGGNYGQRDILRKLRSFI